MRFNYLIMVALAAASCWTSNALAQKKPLDHDVYDSWQSVSGIKRSDDGRVLVWNVNPQEGDGTLYVRSFASLRMTKKSRAAGHSERNEESTLAIPRGYQPTIDPAGKWVVCRIKPEFAKTRQERIDKKKKDEQSKDTLAVIDLSTMQIRKFASVESYSAGSFGMPFIAYKSTWKNDKKNESGLIILTPGNWQADTLKHIDNYVFSNSGSLLALTTKEDKKDSLSATSIVLASYSGNKIVLDTLKKGDKEYFRPVFDDAEAQLAFTATTDSNKTGSKRCGMYLAQGDKWNVRELIPQGTKVAGTDGWTLTENSSIFFTPDGKRIVTGIAPVRPPKDTTIVDFETAQLDIWNWDAPYTPPQQKKRLDGTLRKTYTAVINLPDARIIPLTTSFFDSIRLLGGGNSEWALSRDNADYARESMWADGSFSDYSLVNLNDGSRKVIAKNFNAGRLDASPSGKYLIWFDNNDNNWYTYNIASGEKVNLTAKAGVAFYTEDDDHPTAYPGAYEGSPKWLENDQAVLIIDRYDVWKFAPDGSKAENLTGGVGRQTHNRFRTMDLRIDKRTDNERRSGVVNPFKAKDELFFSLINEDNKKNGYGRLNLAKPAKTLKYFTDTVTFQGPQMATDGSITFLKGNFRHPFDLYRTNDFFASSEKLSAINPQMADYRWGTANLFEWMAYDGTPLKGLVFIPDGIKPGEKLPVMIYFYEKYSDQLYNFWQPAPSRSTVNLSFYTSRGYIVFVPDIVYKDGHPGESAYNCICSGAEALCEKYSFADKSKMAIQGQSWGGYQTAWLVTRTNMFAAAGAGAPVSNMTSAYGGIRWESGMTRAGQYEHGQSRIGKTLWDEGGLDLYIENSPIFHADKVETPLLIMHNDNDGAVPWYQGIEYYSDLRRLGKPCWLLEYNNEAHNLVERRNCKDLSRRLQQFFDHYLKGAPMPAWMKSGVPTDRKGEYFGFEY
ncbi:MAG: S9 family peptidase [Bacteroidales bacterium]|nr:S9 family peptidase [Bacteroidales bacterium]